MKQNTPSAISSFAITCTNIDTSGSQVTGIIYISIDGVAFPEADWNDAVLSIAQFWMEEFDVISNQDELNCIFPFMDGSLRFTILGSGANLTLSCFNGATCVLRATVRRSELLAAIKMYADTVKQFAKNR